MTFKAAKSCRGHIHHRQLVAYGLHHSASRYACSVSNDRKNAPSCYDPHTDSYHSFVLPSDCASAKLKVHAVNHNLLLCLSRLHISDQGIPVIACVGNHRFYLMRLNYCLGLCDVSLLASRKRETDKASTAAWSLFVKAPWLRPRAFASALLFYRLRAHRHAAGG